MPTKVLFGMTLSVAESDPTPDQIRDCCEAIRESWSAKEHQRRLAQPVDPLTVPGAGDLRDRRKGAWL